MDVYRCELAGLRYVILRHLRFLNLHRRYKHRNGRDGGQGVIRYLAKAMFLK